MLLLVQDTLRVTRLLGVAAMLLQLYTEKKLSNVYIHVHQIHRSIVCIPPPYYATITIDCRIYNVWLSGLLHSVANLLKTMQHTVV